MDWVAGVFDAAQQWVFENTIQPLLFMSARVKVVVALVMQPTAEYL